MTDTDKTAQAHRLAHELLRCFGETFTEDQAAEIVALAEILQTWKPVVGDKVIATLPGGDDLTATVVRVGDRMARVEFLNPPPGVRNSYPLHINRLRPLVAETTGSTT